jgi:hypothetical protein
LILSSDADKSGVGPKEHLRDVGIPCIHDLPGVGSTLVRITPDISLTGNSKTTSTLP